MIKERKSVDYIFLVISCVLIFAGALAFFSASLGVLARSQSIFYSTILSQTVLGLIGGLCAMFIFSRISTKILQKYATLILVSSILITALVFVPHLGFAHGGARRWISILGISFQPVEILKVAFIIYLSAWLSWAKKRVESPLYGILPMFVVLGIIAGVLLLQPDTKSLILMVSTGIAMLFLSGTPWKHLLILGGIAITVFIIFAIRTPYLAQRVSTFLNPTNDPSGSSYQLQQSLIAIGSGKWSGRGYGQSIQKFSYLPEPQGDSIFAVIGEEMGFIGSTIIVLLYILFAMRGLWIARRSADSFSGLLASGLVILITLQSFMNIASIIGLFPLTGVPLVFMSQGGTSLLISLAMVGIILGISKERKV